MKRMTLCPFVLVLCLAVVLAGPVSAQLASQNIPVLPVIPESSGDPAWYLKGDGYLQRQVEPTIAVSTRNPDHLLSFFVDYRAVVGAIDDVGLGEETQTLTAAMAATSLLLNGLITVPDIPHLKTPPVAASEAWVGGSASHDGGLTWNGFFMPGAEFDQTQFSQDSPVYGLQAATDPVAVAGPCGYVYVAFMAFTRGDISKMVVARFQDRNDSESGRTWQYQGATVLISGNNAEWGYFVDKPHLAIDVFREDSDYAAYSQYYDPEEYECGHRLYTSFSTFNGLDRFGKFQSKINFAVSVDKGETWELSKIQQPYSQNQGSFIAVDPRPGTPKDGGGGSVYLVWRHFNSPDAIVKIKTEDYGKKWTKPIELTGDIAMAAFDQPTYSAYDGPNAPSPANLTARSNAFPTAAVTGEGTVFVAWQEKVDITEGSQTFGEPDELGSPRIVIVRSTTGGDSWTDIYGTPGARVAVDLGYRDVGCVPGGPDYPDDCQQPPGFGVLPQERLSGPQVKPWLSFGGGRLALAYTEARGFLEDTFFGISEYDLSDNTDFISGIDRVVDFRVALLDPATGQLEPNGTTQVSRYPISGSALLDDGEQVSDIAPVAPFLCEDVGLAEYCQPSLNLYNKNHSGAGQVPFMGDYPGMSPIMPLVYDDINDEGPKIWRWAIEERDVPYPAFHVVFPDNRHLIPPTYPSNVDPGTEIDEWQEWERYPYYNFPPTDEDPDCRNPGSRNTDVLTAKVNTGLVLSAPTTYIQDPLAGEEDPPWGYPISVFNQSGGTRFFELTIIEGAGPATFVVDPDLLQDQNIDPYSGFVEIFAYSSTSQMVYVNPTADVQIVIEVEEVDCELVLDEFEEPVVNEYGEFEYLCQEPDGEVGYVTLNPDPSNPDVVGSDDQKLVIVKEAVEIYDADDVDIEALNPFVKNPFVKNPFVKNPFVKNTAIGGQDPVKIIDTTWSVQATEDSGAGSYLPVINIDNADEFLKNYAFQLLIYKNASYGVVAALEGCETLNAGNPVILSNVSQSPGDEAQNPFVKNPFVKNPFVKNPFVKNPFVKNPFVRNSAITVAPAEGVYQTTQSSTIQGGTKNLVFEDDGTLRVPRLPEKIFITLRAFQLVENDALGQFVYDPDIDEPALSVVPTRCTDLSDCVASLSPDLVSNDILVTDPTYPEEYADLPNRTPPTDPEDPPVVPVQVPLGEILTFDFTLVNQGNVWAEAEDGNFRHAFFLSADSKVDLEVDLNGNHIPTNGDVRLNLGTGDDPPKFLLSEESLPAKPNDEDDPPNTELFENITVVIPDDVDPLDYEWLILFVDDYREVSENNEPNNQHAMRVKLVKLNHAPTFTMAEDLLIYEDHNGDGVFSDIWATNIDDGESDPQEQGMDFEVNADNPELFDEQPTIVIDETTYEGTLSFDLAPNAYGSTLVTVKLKDDGETTVPGSFDSTTKDFTLTVLPVNDAPSFAPGLPPDSDPKTFDVTKLEDAGSITLVNWAVEITAGPLEDDDQTVSFVGPTNDNPDLFYVLPQVDEYGTLTFTTMPNAFGSATLTIYLQDTGTHPDANDALTSDVEEFTITITPDPDYDLLGLYDPWREHPVYTAKVGSAIPLKWQYAQDGVVVNTSELYPTVMVRGPFDCAYVPENPEDPNEPPPAPPDPKATWAEYEPLNDPGASDYRYTLDTDTWQFNWDTNDLGAGCYNAYVRNHLYNEVSRPFRIKLK